MELIEAVNFFIEKFGGEIIGRSYGRSLLYMKILLNNNKIKYVTLKREWFYSFGKIFNKEGKGQSFSEKTVKEAINDNAMLVVVMPDKNIYEIKAKECYDYVVKNNTVRHVEGEISPNYSVPKDLLQKIYPPETKNIQSNDNSLDGFI